METIKKLTNVLESPQESGSWTPTGNTGTTPSHSTPYYPTPTEWNYYHNYWAGYTPHWMNQPNTWGGYPTYPNAYYPSSSYNWQPTTYRSFNHAYPYNDMPMTQSYNNAYTPMSQSYYNGVTPYSTPYDGTTPSYGQNYGTTPESTPYYGTPMTQHGYQSNAYRNWTPTANVYEDEKTYRIEMACPSMTKNDFKVWTENNMLWVTGYKNRNGATMKVKNSEKEYNNYSFNRWFMIPGSVNLSKIHAKCTNGMLYLTLTKKTGKAANEVPIS